jgi:cardiolipin synthase
MPTGVTNRDLWQELSRRLTPIPVLGVSDWAKLRGQLFADIMPREPNQGVAVSFDRLDYFFFYDKLGNFRARRLMDKPAWYSVSKYLDLQKNFETWQPVLDKFMAEAGIESDDVIFNTGGLDNGSIPFLYINTRSKLIVLVQYDELPETVIEGVPGAHFLQAAWHFLESHTYTIAMRPFSSLHSLLSVVSDTALETGRGLISATNYDEPIPRLNDGPSMDLIQWEQDLDTLLKRPASRGKLKFLVDGEAFFPRFVDLLTSAKESVDIRTYIFDTDDVALSIGDLLKRRSREGVDVRVLFDGMGSIVASGEHSSTLPDSHRSPVSIESYLKQNSQVDVRAVNNPWLTGDHVKTMVIDRRTAFLGGMNIGREYRYDWHDMMVEVQGPVVDEINREFQQAWGKAGFFGDFSNMFNFRSYDFNQHSDGYPVRLIYTKTGQQEIFVLQREAIRRSKRYIYIENAYFTDDSLMKELILARRRGVDVRVIIPLETDRGYITRNIVLAANTMLANGIRIYIYPGFSHAKAAIFDGWASVGSANMDRLSLRINQEISIATADTTAVEALKEKLFEPDFKKSTELTEAIPGRWSDYIIEMFGDYVF